MPEQIESPASNAQDTTSLGWRDPFRKLWHAIISPGGGIIAIATGVITALLTTGIPNWWLTYWQITLSVLFIPLVLISIIGILAHWPVKNRQQQPADKRAHTIMLERVHRYYAADPVQLLDQTKRIPWTIVQQPNNPIQRPRYPRPPRLLPMDTYLQQLADATRHGLLILGEPGVGKSALLVTLALHLVEQAKLDERQPIPIIVPLATWSTTKSSDFYKWLYEQIEQIYKVSPHLSEYWLQRDQLLLLLDGLDEMDADARQECATAINSYHRDRAGLVPFVVCCREQEYKEYATTTRNNNLPNALPIQATVIIDPLTPEQVDRYLLHSGKPVDALRKALKSTTYRSLQDLATTPLMLNILTQTYQGKTISAFSNNRTQLLQQIWADYVETMMASRGQRHYQQAQIYNWLHQLALNGAGIFYLERMQPEWLKRSQHHAAAGDRDYERYAVRWPGAIIGGLISITVYLLLFRSLDLTNLIAYSFLGGQLGALFSSSPPQKTGSMLFLSLRNALRLGLATWFSILLLNLASSPVAWFTGSKLFRDQGYMPVDWLHSGIATGLSCMFSAAILNYLFLSQRQWFGFSVPVSGSTQPSPGFQSVKVSWREAWQEITRAGTRKFAALVGVTGAVIGVTFGLISFSAFAQQDGYAYYGIPFGVRDGLSYLLAFSLISFLLRLSAVFIGGDRNIHPIEILKWSGRSLLTSLRSYKHFKHASFFALGVGVISGIDFGLVSFLSNCLGGRGDGCWKGVNTGFSIFVTDIIAYSISFGLAYWLLFGFLRGLSNEYLEDRNIIKLNEGIRRSLRISIQVGISSGIVIGCIGFLNTILYFMLTNGFSQGITIGMSAGWLAAQSNAASGLSSGLTIGLWTALSGGLLASILVGGLACLRHVTLRLLLARYQIIAYKFRGFLQLADQCAFLRKEGGGYRFTHDLLREYFIQHPEPPVH